MTIKTEAFLRHARNYRKIICNIDEYFISGVENAERAVKMFDAESANIMRAQKWAEENFENNSEASLVCHE